jgi:hypothetical protein
MELSHFSDLTVELGKLYLYRHQGGCDHRVFVSDVRYIIASLFPM